MDDKTLKMWRESIAPGMTSGDSIRAKGWNAQIDTLALPRSRSLGSAGKKRDDAVDFEIRNKIGAGGMGVVYTAHQTAINRKVALKMIRPEHADSQAAAEALMSEAVVTGCLDHPNVVPVYDLGRDENGHLFYAMKEVEGFPWSTVMEGKAFDENLDILLRVADTIAFAHSKGILHRDLKPQNIMLGSFGEIMVMDWGAACALDGANVVGAPPSDTAYYGTPAYMAPEMAKADKNRLGETSDIYLLGAILYQILTGRPPRCEKDPLICLAAAAENRIDPAEGGELLRIALKAMAEAPADRFQKVEDFQHAIRQYRSHAESLTLLANAKVNLALAQEHSNYDKFNRTVYGLREALTLWEGNADAVVLLESTVLDYARCAMRQYDYELALSLLDQNNRGHAELINEIGLTIKERDARKNRLRRTLFISRTLFVIIAMLFVVGFFMIRAQQRETELQRQEAVAQKQEAEILREQAYREHRQSLVNLISAHYGEENYEAVVADFWQLHDQYGSDGPRDSTLRVVPNAAVMNPWRGAIETGIVNPLGITQTIESNCVWVVGKRELKKIRRESDSGYDPATFVVVHGYKLGKHLPPGSIIDSIRLPFDLAGIAAVHESNDGVLWAGSGSVVYRKDGEKWIPVLNASLLDYPPLPKEYNIDRVAMETWMASTGRKQPISGVLLNEAQTHVAVTLGGNTVCWIDIRKQLCLGWFAVGHGTLFKTLLKGGSLEDAALCISRNEDQLIFRPAVRNRSMVYSFDLPSMKRKHFVYNKESPVCTISYPEPDRYCAVVRNGYSFSPSLSFEERFRATAFQPQRQHMKRWEPTKGDVRKLSCNNIFLAAVSPDGKSQCLLGDDGRLFVESANDFEFVRRISDREYVACWLFDDLQACLLDANGLVHVYTPKRTDQHAITSANKPN